MTGDPPVALVTGAGGHLGAVICRELGARGVRLAINDLDPAAAVALADSIPAGVALPGDLTDPSFASELVDQVVDGVGPVDALVNLVGTEGPIGPIESLDPDAVRTVFEINVMSMFWSCRAVVPGMKRAGGGRIVNMASGAGLAGGALASAYHASKHAVVGLTRSLGRELAADSISVNAVCPGYIDSPMVDRITTAEAAVGMPNEPVAAIPMQRLGDPGEVAAVVTFLALDAPLYMTGSCLELDGALRA